ncbi:MAG TPA: CPBP family intramembrane glutamic endopeptidase [Steroidobacteraceae bacterium]|nr:CPBP family intramembrane glutamic endopeptidase [Steroidobacteraceae bacterium]
MRTFAWFLLMMALALLSIAVFTYPAWLLLHPHFDFPFHRIGERIGMLGLLAGFVLLARRLGLADRLSLGYGVPRRVFVREAVLGLIVGVATMTMVVAAMAVLGLLDWSRAASISAAGVARLVLLRFFSGVAVALIEETFLRGAMQTGIARESGMPAAIILTALVYSATHFFASYHIAADAVTPYSGVDLLLGTLHAFAQPGAIIDAFLALTAVGVLLAMIRATTGNIAACIGLHAGWVWVILVVHELTQPRRDATLGFLLSRFDGFVGWLVLAWIVLLAVPLWRFYQQRAAAQAALSRAA